MLKFVLAALLSNPVVKKLKQNTIGDNLLHMCSIQGIMHLLVSIPDYSPLVKPTHLVNSASIDDDEDDNEDNISISCGILVSGIRARGVSSEHMDNMEMFSCSPT